MMLLAAWLLAVGVVDVVRGSHDEVSPRRARVAIGAGTATLALSPGPLALGLLGWLPVTLVGLLLLATWVGTSQRAVAVEDAGSPLVPLLVLAVPALGLVAASGSAWADVAAYEWLQRWYSSVDLPVLAGVRLEAFLVGLGVVVVLTNTSNVLVRIVLRAADAPAERAERRLKGGRLLGPMERVFIFFLALQGELAAASVVAGAKSLLRFPEVRVAAGRNGKDPITEYFLIGSFTSWLLALLFVGLF